MKTVFKKENLFIRIAIGFGAGILLGTLAPQFSIDAKVIGDVYLNIIKMMVIPVLICAVMTGIINSSNLASLKRVAVKTVLLYVVMFLASFAVSFGMAMMIRPGVGVEFENEYEDREPGGGSVTNRFSYTEKDGWEGSTQVADDTEESIQNPIQQLNPNTKN